MLDELLARPVTRNLRKPPSTAARFAVKIKSFSVVERWWFDKLREGLLLPWHSAWDKEVPKKALGDDYAAAAREFGVGRSEHYLRSELGERLQKLCPGIRERQPARRETDGRRWIVPSLEECRESFSKIAFGAADAYDWKADAGLATGAAGDEEL